MISCEQINLENYTSRLLPQQKLATPKLEVVERSHFRVCPNRRTKINYYNRFCFSSIDEQQGKKKVLLFHFHGRDYSMVQDKTDTESHKTLSSTRDSIEKGTQNVRHVCKKRSFVARSISAPFQLSIHGTILAPCQ